MFSSHLTARNTTEVLMHITLPSKPEFITYSLHSPPILPLLFYPSTTSPPLDPPIASPVTELTSVMVGNPLMLTVTITNFNLPIDTIDWTFNNKSIINNTNMFTILNSGGLDEPPAMSTLRLNSVSNLTNEGTYVVTVSNRAGSNTSTFTVTVTGKRVVAYKVEHFILDYFLYYSNRA